VNSTPLVDLRAQQQSLERELNEVLSGALSRTDWILGESVEAFESEFAAYCGTKHAIGTDSGLSALELLLRAYGLGSGDEVIIPANTFIATAFAISHAGATPVLVDCDAESHNIAPGLIEQALTPRTRAIVPVHLYGRPAAMSEIIQIARAHGLIVIEDACQGHGATYRGHRVGSIGDAAAFSFYPGKNLGALGDGGIAVTSDRTIYDRLRMLRNYGQSSKYHHSMVGFNRRLDTLQAALLRVKLRHLDRWNAARAAGARAYSDAFAGTAVVPPSSLPDHLSSAWHLYVVQVAERTLVQARLKESGIATGIHYPIPIHRQPAYADLGYAEGSFPVTERLADRVLSLPLYPELAIDRIHAVARVLLEVVGKAPGSVRDREPIAVSAGD
jgi:dTDP-4-amino-4,6-dideoxygalactose transaminase